MNNNLVYHLSLTFFGVAISLSNSVEVLRSPNSFSAIMAMGGIGLAAAALRPVLNGDYREHESNGNWTYLLAFGALMMMAGAGLQLLTMV